MSFGQGGYQGPQGPTAPDWGALADAAAADRRRKRRWLLIGGGALATVAIAGVVATAVVTTDDKSPSADASSSLPTPESLDPKPPSPSFSEVTPPPPPDPMDYISSAKKDKAPLSAGSLFPAKKVTMKGRAYTRAATSTTGTCSAAAAGGLGAVLDRNGCGKLFRATYERGGIAVTVGIAVFPDDSRAARAKDQSTGNLQSLPGNGVPTFCRATACRLTSNSIGRYGYFTVAGYTNGTAVTTADTKARQAGRDLSNYAFSRIVERGKAQASAAAEEP